MTRESALAPKPIESQISVDRGQKILLQVSLYEMGGG
jgi:hypothetical protein